MINFDTLLIESAPTYEDGARFLNTKFRDNKKRIKARFLDVLSIWLQMNDIENFMDIVRFYENLCDEFKSFTYKEAFGIEDNNFRALVFSAIDVPEMIRNLGTERIKADGIELKNLVYENGFFINKPLTQLYELHKVNGTSLGINEDIYAIKCWCTSTNAEHWLWIDSDEGKKNDPLSAIASTCKIYKCMQGKIKHIIRQGDVFIFEMTEEVVPNESDEIISLDKGTYFNLLKSQS